MSTAKTFDFTKRKRWADLLLADLVDNIPLIISVSGKILYCGNAVTDLLGWRDVDLIDVDFVNLVDVPDQPRFVTVFNHSLNSSLEFNVLLRLRHRDFGAHTQPKFVLFDFKCYPHLDDSYVTRCFFGMAAPHPSRNKAMLDSILDLKAENIRLQHLIAEHRARKSQEANSNPSTSTLSNGPSIYATSTLTTQEPRPFISCAYMPSSASFGPSDGQFPHLAYESDSMLLEEQEEEGSKKKKLKRIHHHLDQHVCVTCGRTESPEWRKGPTGPKTLCNACGLRWAKQMRKTDEPTEMLA